MSAIPAGHTPGGIDFTKLTERSLLNYCGHHNLSGVALPTNKASLAATCARHFRSWTVDEDEVLRMFKEAVATGFASRELGGGPRFRKRSRAGGEGGLPAAKAGARSPASAASVADKLKPGEKVAAKVAQISQTDENGSWILASVQKYFANADRYEVADEDETSRKFVVDACHVLRLTDNVDGLHKGVTVLAMFPDTTSFYRAKMAKSLKRGVTEALVHFEDDEDQETGRTPSRKVPARYVMLMPPGQ